MLGFLLFNRFFNDCIATFGCTVLDRIRSEISKLRAMSSLLQCISIYRLCSSLQHTDKLEDVARSIWRSSSVLPELNQPAMLGYVLALS